MNIVFSLLLFLVLLVVLVRSAQILEDALVLLSDKLNISTFITGFVILAGASTLPEFSVAINSAVQRVPDLSIGNLFGATVFVLTFLVGIFAVRHGKIPFNGIFSRHEVMLSLLLVIAQVLVFLDEQLTSLEGILLISGYLALIIYLIFHSKTKTLSYTIEITNSKDIRSALLKSILGIVGLLISANFLVTIAVDIAHFFEVSETLIGVLMLGIGTNLPELTILLTSNNVEKDKLAVGNFIGSAVANVPTLGLLAVLLPHEVEGFVALLPVFFALSIGCILFTLFAWTKKSISFREGILLMFVFVALVIIEAFRFQIFGL